MSQHLLRTTMGLEPVQVLMGYDRPLGHFFLVVTRLQAADDEDDLIYSNLSDPLAGLARDLNRYRDILNGLGIPVPVSMISNVLQDAAERAGNKTVLYEADGTWSLLQGEGGLSCPH